MTLRPALSPFTDDFSPFTVVYNFNGGNGTKDAPLSYRYREQAYNMRNAKDILNLLTMLLLATRFISRAKPWLLTLTAIRLSLEYADDVKPNNGGVFNVAGKKSSLTINDSARLRPVPLSVPNQRAIRTKSPLRSRGNYGKLTINGGHFYGTSD